MATYSSPEAARAANSGGTSNAAESVKTVQNSKRAHRNSHPGATYYDRDQVWQISGASEVAG